VGTGYQNNFKDSSVLLIKATKGGNKNEM